MSAASSVGSATILNTNARLNALLRSWGTERTITGPAVVSATDPNQQVLAPSLTYTGQLTIQNIGDNPVTIVNAGTGYPIPPGRSLALRLAQGYQVLYEGNGEVQFAWVIRE